MVSDEEIISEAIKHKGDCQRPYEPCDRCILEAINLTREKVIKYVKDNLECPNCGLVSWDKTQLFKELKSGRVVQVREDGREFHKDSTVPDAGSNPAPAKRLKCYLAFNPKEYDVENMSINKTKKDIIRYWGGEGQELWKAEIILIEKLKSGSEGGRE